MNYVETVLYEAALRASREMGGLLLEMSCFLSRWPEITVELAVQTDVKSECAQAVAGS